MSCRSRRTGSTGSCLHSCGSARVSPRPRAPRRLPRATAPLPRRRTTPREGLETPRLSSCYRPFRERARARPDTTSPRWSSLFRWRCAAWERSGRGWIPARGAVSRVSRARRAAFAADLRVGTPLVRGDVGRSRARRKREPQTRDARSRRRRVGTGGSFTHPKAPRPRASAATGAAPCRLASRPSGATAVGCVGTSDV